VLVLYSQCTDAERFAKARDNLPDIYGAICGGLRSLLPSLPSMSVPRGQRKLEELRAPLLFGSEAVVRAWSE
jgi:hypothetical protein